MNMNVTRLLPVLLLLCPGGYAWAAQDRIEQLDARWDCRNDVEGE